EAAPNTPREVARVDRQAMTADTGPGGERHEAERLGGGGLDRRPDINAQIGSEHRELVDQRDVDVAKGVLQELRELRLARAGVADRFLDDRAVEGFDGGERRLVDSRDHLWRIDEVPGLVPRVDALGAVAEVEVSAGGKARPGLEDGRDELFGGAGIG